MSHQPPQFVWWGWRDALHWPLVGRYRYGPQSRPDWWMFTAYRIGPLEIRVWRKNPPWEQDAR